MGTGGQWRQVHQWLQYGTKGEQMSHESQKKYYERMKAEHPEVLKGWYRTAYLNRCKQEALDIIQQHHEDLKDDPERLTDEFIRKIIEGDSK